MLFILQCLDRAGSRALRNQARVPHLEFVAAHAKVFRFGGPLLGDDGRVVGSLMILELPDRAALDLHIATDPFFSAGLFHVVNVWQTQQVVPEHTPGALAHEIATARARAAEPLLRDSGSIALRRPSGELAP
jgi:uncharacterized protein